jgi:hypothetical protein
MTEEEQRRFEALEVLRAAAYTSFNDRRGHEWKFSLSIWTALAILLAGLVQPLKPGEVFPLRGTCVWVAFALAGLLLVVLHAVWSYWVFRANYIDNKIRFHFRDEMINNTLKLPFSSELNEIITKHLQPPFEWTHRYPLVQVGTTLLLVVGVVLIVYVRGT